MSMSQKRLTLMNGLEISDDNNEPEGSGRNKPKVNTKRDRRLLSQTEEVKEDIDSKEEVFNLENLEVRTIHKEIVDNTEIDELLKDIESSTTYKKLKKMMKLFL